MAARLISETERVRYLLGLSSPAERAHIESEYLEDDDAFQEMLAAEDDLIDAYACGELTGEERRRFEENFVTGARGRVQFARAFANAVSATRPLESKHPGTLLDIFQSAGLLRAATIAAVVVFLAILAWLINDRKRMTNELRELRAQSAEPRKQTEALQRASDTDGTRTAELNAQRTRILPEPDKPGHRKRATTTTQQGRHLPRKREQAERVMNTVAALQTGAVDKSPLIPIVKPEEGGNVINTQDASLGNTFPSKTITELPLNARDEANLLTLQPGTTRGVYVGGGRADQTNITLDGVDVDEPLNTYSLKVRNSSSSGDNVIRIPSFRTWIRFQLLLATVATHEEYRIIIKRANSRPLTTVNWIEPLTPHQTMIDTPAIATDDLPSGDYALWLMGKKPDGSFIRVGDYPFKVIKD